MHRAGQPVIAARLTEKMGVSAPTAWNTVRRMQRDGLRADRRGEDDLALAGRSGGRPSRSSGPAICLTERLLVAHPGNRLADAHEEGAPDRAHDHAARRGAHPWRCWTTRRRARTATPSRPRPGDAADGRARCSDVSAGDEWENRRRPTGFSRRGDHDLMRLPSATASLPGAEGEGGPASRSNNSTIGLEVAGVRSTLGMRAGRERCGIVVARPTAGVVPPVRS